jgi:peptidoglycan/LPS O-acetylase OafA/YrhL
VKNRLVHLDFLRGLAALLVVSEHLRAFFFVTFPELQSPGILAKAFYLVTGLGHQSVMIFFVLSGYLVGGSVLSALEKGKWSWQSYLLRRMSRLWVVLIPALILTLFWDKIGYAFAPAGYEGAYRAIYNTGPTPTGPAQWSLPLFFGNLAFLQTISIPCFGTNSPLWSLANEFWYYLLLPLLLTACMPGKLSVRIPSLLAAMLLITLLPASVLFGGLIWVSGVVVFFVLRSASVRTIAGHPLWLGFGLLLTVGMLLATRTGHMGGLPGDLALGLACAILVAGLACTNSANTLYGKISAGMSDISYTLYLVHFPLMAFVFFVFFHGQQIVPSAVTSLCFVGLLSVTLAYSMGIWWLFERNTDEVRVFVESKIDLLTDREPIPARFGVPWLMPWMLARRISTLGERSVVLWRRIRATGDLYLGAPWTRALLRPGPALTYSSLYLILFMMVSDRC